MKIYVLSHQYYYDEFEEKSEIRTIGVYSDKKKVLNSIKKYKKIKGFSSHLDGFYLTMYKLDKSLSWLEGYRTGYFDREQGFLYKEENK